MRYLPILPVLAVLLWGCAAPTRQVDNPRMPGKTVVVLEQPTELKGTQAYALGEMVSKGNVSVYPVMMVAKTPDQSAAQDVATLTEALAQGWLTVTEVGNGGTVDTLLVRNDGPRPVLLLAGELLQGGKQDRIVIKDTILPPGVTTKVSVNCVEHGRWTSGKETFKPLSYQAPASVRAKAMYEDQSAVWGSVSEYNNAAGYKGAETSVNRGLEKTGATADFLKDSRLLADLALADPRTVGAVILINGEIATFELFGNHRLIKGSLAGILAGAFSERVPLSAEPGTATRTVVAKFVSDVLAGRRLNQGMENGASHAQVQASDAEGKEIGGSGYKATASPAEGVNGVLHGSYQQAK